MPFVSKIRGLFLWGKSADKKIDPELNQLMKQLRTSPDYDTPENEEALMSFTDRVIKQLQKCTKYDTPEVEKALTSLADIPICLLQQGSVEEITEDDHDESGQVFTSPGFVRRCQTVGEYLVKAGYISLFVMIAESLKHHVCGGSRHGQQGWINFGLLCWGLINFAEFTPKIGLELSKSEGVKILLQALDFNAKKGVRVNSEISTNKMQLLLLCLVYHCRSPDNIWDYRQANAVEILTKYLKSKDVSRKTYALLTLASITSEAQNDKLRANDSVKFLVEQLGEAVYSPNHTAIFKDVEGILVAVTLLDILDGVNNLMRNDNNKRAFHNYGGTGFANEILKGEFVDKERALMSKVLWKLAFIEEIKKTPTFKSATACLKLHIESNHEDLRRNSAYAIWEIEGNKPDTDTDDQPTTSDHPVTAEQQEVTSSAAGADCRRRRVMLSYQWDSQKTVKRIKEELEAAGFDVWMDVDKLRNNMVTAMAEAVDTSDAIIICMTEKYKNSTYARSEAEYAYKKKKHLIMLLMEDGYSPDGWLDFIQGMRLYYKFCTEKDFKDNMPKVIGVIKEGDNK